MKAGEVTKVERREAELLLACNFNKIVLSLEIGAPFGAPPQLKQRERATPIRQGSPNTGAQVALPKVANIGEDMKTKIDDCKKYWNEFVQPDYQEFINGPGDVRKAFHCAISLYIAGLLL